MKNEARYFLLFCFSCLFFFPSRIHETHGDVQRNCKEKKYAHRRKTSAVINHHDPS